MFELIGKTNIDFIGMKKFSFIISAIISLVGIFALFQVATGSANLGIDFTGGTVVQLKFEQPVPLQQAREVLAKHGLKDANLQEIKDGNKLLIKVGKNALAVGKAAQIVEETFTKELANHPFTVESTSEIGPSIGDKLRKDTLLAVSISLLAIVIYVAFRFDFKFGIGALAATLHDILAIFAAFLIMGKEVNLLLITAVLTIAGYSLTDTVVVFDRIRENLHRDLKGSMAFIFNKSINEVLSRTIVTSLTTFLAAISLLVFGGEVIHDFSLALVVGVVVATYSSVFVASPIVSILEKPKVKEAA